MPKTRARITNDKLKLKNDQGVKQYFIYNICQGTFACCTRNTDVCTPAPRGTDTLTLPFSVPQDGAELLDGTRPSHGSCPVSPSLRPPEQNRDAYGKTPTALAMQVNSALHPAVAAAASFPILRAGCMGPRRVTARSNNSGAPHVGARCRAGQNCGFGLERMACAGLVSVLPRQGPYPGGREPGAYTHTCLLCHLEHGETKGRRLANARGAVNRARGGRRICPLRHRILICSYGKHPTGWNTVL
jgi:hypothetical protein